MTIETLKRRLTDDLKRLELPVYEVTLCIRPYSKTYYGNYFPQYDNEGKPRIYLYPFRNKQGDMYSYSMIMDTFIHEFCHHLQYSNPLWVREEGIMHDPDFWRLYNKYIFRAKLIGVINDDYESEAA